MAIDLLILDKVRSLPPERQQEVVDFIEFLDRKTSAPRQATRLKGLCADLGIHITADEIDEVRRGVWQNFPREDV